MPNDRRGRLDVSISVLNWIVRQTTRFIVDGTGNQILDDGTETERGGAPGLIDELHADSEVYRFVGWMLQFMRVIKEIAQAALHSEIENIDTNDLPAIEPWPGFDETGDPPADL